MTIKCTEAKPKNKENSSIDLFHLPKMWSFVQLIIWITIMIWIYSLPLHPLFPSSMSPLPPGRLEWTQRQMSPGSVFLITCGAERERMTYCALVTERSPAWFPWQLTCFDIITASCSIKLCALERERHTQRENERERERGREGEKRNCGREGERHLGTWNHSVPVSTGLWSVG